MEKYIPFYNSNVSFSLTNALMVTNTGNYGGIEINCLDFEVNWTSSTYEAGLIYNKIGNKYDVLILTGSKRGFFATIDATTITYRNSISVSVSYSDVVKAIKVGNTVDVFIKGVKVITIDRSTACSQVGEFKLGISATGLSTVRFSKITLGELDNSLIPPVEPPIDPPIDPPPPTEPPVEPPVEPTSFVLGIKL